MSGEAAFAYDRSTCASRRSSHSTPENQQRHLTASTMFDLSKAHVGIGLSRINYNVQWSSAQKIMESDLLEQVHSRRLRMHVVTGHAGRVFDSYTGHPIDAAKLRKGASLFSRASLVRGGRARSRE